MVHSFLEGGGQYLPRELLIENTISGFSYDDIDDLIERMR
jgi:hypothetical protein